MKRTNTLCKRPGQWEPVRILQPHRKAVAAVVHRAEAVAAPPTEEGDCSPGKVGGSEQ
jgi:hypothetical protein